MADRDWVHSLPSSTHPTEALPPRVDELARRALTAIWADAPGEFSSWPVEDRRLVALRIHANACASGGPPDFGPARVFADLVAGVRWSREDLMWSLRQLSTEWGLDDGAAFQLPPLIAAALPPEQLAGFLTAFESIFDEVKDSRIPMRERWELCERYGEVLDRFTTGLPAKLLHSGDSFGPATRAALAAELAEPGVRELFLHAATLTKPVPPPKWRRRAEELWSATPQGPAAVRPVLRRFAGFGGYLHDDTDVLVRGLTSLLACDGSDEATAMICGVAVGAGAAPPRRSGYPFAPRTAAAAVEILIDRSGDESVRALARLALTVKNKALQTRVQAGLSRVGARRGWAPGEALELVVDSHGLTADGRREFTAEGRTALVELVGDKAKLSILDGPGPEPAFVEARELVKQINKTLPIERIRIESLLSQEREWPVAAWIARYLRHPVIATWARRLIWQAIEPGGGTTAGVPECREGRWFLAGPEGDVPIEAEPPAAEPSGAESAAVGLGGAESAAVESSGAESAAVGLGGAESVAVESGGVGSVAVGLGGEGSAAGEPGVVERGSDGRGIGERGLGEVGAEPGRAGLRVRLWHPARADAGEVAAWRDHIAETGLRQPFKQAFREVYPLTPAEAVTRTYSNRFAGHILRYRQASALIRARGWQAPYLGHWDGGYHSEATREFAAGQWRAIFFHELARDDDPHSYQAEYCATDQVRFARLTGRAWEQAPLAEVPPLVFSEAMRDVDLFVGVTSIAADESWRDHGEDRFLEYWQRTTVGPLTAIAEVRRDALARILPRLAIASRCELTERFLRVRGTRGAYKIHLGSGNVLMEPNDAYLCIVMARPKRPPVQLPFDDDALLSLILSKAILLATDARITDPTILRQLPNRPADAADQGAIRGSEPG